MSKVVTVIDTFGFFFRSFYALPQYLKNKDGFPTGLLTGFTNFISTLQKQHESDYLVFAIDSKGPTFRNEIDQNYKAHRTAPPEELLMQLPIAIEWIDKMGYKTLCKVGYEADDMIAGVVKFAKKKGYKVRIVSHDKDLFQLIDDGNVVLVDAIKKQTVDEDACLQKYGISPRHFIDYQSILGDSADNIPGVKGVGKVGAQKLISEFGTLDNIYANIENIKPAGVQKKLADYKADAYRSRELVTLRDDAIEDFDFEDYKMDVEHPFLNIYDELVKYEQNAILRTLHAKNLVSAPYVEKIYLEPKENTQSGHENLKEEASFNDTAFILLDDENELQRVLNNIDRDTIVAFDTETTGLDHREDSLVGFSFCFDTKSAYYVPIAHFYLGVGPQISKDIAVKALLRIFNSKVVGHNIKFDLSFVLKFLGRDDLDIYADTMILAWLVDPEGALSLDKLAEKILSRRMISYKETVKKGESFAGVEINDACRYAAEDAYVTYVLYAKLVDKLRIQGAARLIDEAHDVEFPFIKTLLHMESHGIAVDTSLLETFLAKMKLDLSGLTKKIYSLAGREFNINSTQQLGSVLFDEMGLPKGKKTKTGYSTNEQVLSGLINAHEIVPTVLDYREVYKLCSTYIEPLLKLGRQDENSRIYTSFIHTGTATGRLSSKNPNLQNIPTRTPLGTKIREAFVAPKGKKLIGIDYSQIELRLLAHFTQDLVLVDAFECDKDIHLSTAIALFGEEEAVEKRNVAKTVNFGLLYGMGQKKLSQTLGISTSEAKEIIEKYFNSFPTVKDYFRRIVDFSKENGYVETLLGRRRYFDYASASQMFKAAYERESVNSVFQGSASDIIKLSMNKIDGMIIQEALPAKMLLQIHDELIFEVDEDKADILGERFRHIMQNITKLNVPLKATMNIGENWSELK